MSLDTMIKQMERTAVISDLHIPHMDEDAYAITKAYLKDYKPTRLIVNGDLLDFYNLSVFDKNPARKYSVQDEVDAGYQCLKDLRKTVGPDCEMHFLEGNHENRLQRFIWRNPELEGIRDLQLPRLLRLSELQINYIGVSGDYWKKDNGHLKVGDTLVTHGDNRLNGASTSKYAGYSAKNTMMTMQQSVIIGHVHRLAIVNHRTPYGDLVGVEGGSLCEQTGTANWQQGFVTFETVGGKNVNYRAHKIEDKKLWVDGNVYYTE